MHEFRPWSRGLQGNHLRPAPCALRPR